ncbi:MAG: hypothetical protein ACF8QF_13030 [Phycisphaerales bacterium]
MHALICAAAGLTVSLAAASVSNAAVRGDAARIGGAAQFEVQSGLNYTSAWNIGDTRDVPATETFGVVMLAQNSGSAFFIDDVPDTFNFSLNQDGGANLITGAATRVRSWQSGNTVTVAAYTVDSSGWIPAGVDPDGSGDLLDAIRMDVGAFANASADGINGISYPGFSAADVVSVDMVLFIDGAAVFSSAATATDFSDGLGAVGVVGGAAGSGVDEMHIVFNLNVPTPGAASVFGLAGLAAVRRRRR